MKKDLAKKFSMYQGCGFDVLSETDEEPKFEEVTTPLDAILHEIFTPDPVSGFPKGDITYYMTDNGNPQVKDWIQRNLLQPRAAQSGADPQKVSDDLINEFSRQDGENYIDYVSRLSGIRKEAEENIKKLQESNNE